MVAATVGAAVERRNLRTPDVQDLTGATYRQLDHWCRTYAICGMEGEVFSGSPRLFTITEARVIRALVLLGLHGVAVGTYARAVSAALAAQPEATHLTVWMDDIRAVASAHTSVARAQVVAGSSDRVCTVVPLRFAR